jgi:hypothetical protein
MTRMPGLSVLLSLKQINFHVIWGQSVGSLAMMALISCQAVIYTFEARTPGCPGPTEMYPAPSPVGWPCLSFCELPETNPILKTKRNRNARLAWYHHVVIQVPIFVVARCLAQGWWCAESGGVCLV